MLRVCVSAAALLLITNAPSFAGAWLLPENKGVVVVTATGSQGQRAFDGNGVLQSTARYTKVELQALIEYGVTSWFTAIINPGLQHVEIAAPIDARRSGVGYTEAGGRVKVLEGPSWVLSGQTTLRVPGTFDAGNPAAVGYTGVEADLRALFGVSFAVAEMPAFLDLQLAQRFRTDGPPNELRFDATFGLRPAPRWLLMAQAFNVMSEGAGSAVFPSYNYHKLQLSVVYELTHQWALQAGGFTTYAGRNALQENGVLAATWYKF